MTKLLSKRTWRNGDSAYHTKWECPHVGANHHEVADDNPRLAELELCTWCAGEAGADTPRESTCPYCGSQVSLLPNHLPCGASQ
jgi:hypothetical protein